MPQAIRLPSHAVARRLRTRLRHRLGATLIAGGLAAGALVAGGTLSPHSVRAATTFESALFALINQDRANAGVPALSWSDQLGGIAETGSYTGCGFTISGRARDMIDRNYFSHYFCGSQNVFNMMGAAGVHYSAAGENIGWESGITDPQAAADLLNNAYMNSPEHKANILNRSFTTVGVGGWATAPGQVWTGAGSPLQNVLMSSEVFSGGSGTTVRPSSSHRKHHVHHRRHRRHR